MMRILSVNKFYYIKGGCERYMFNLNQLLEEKGYQIIQFSMEHPANRESQYSSFFVSQVDFFSPNSFPNKFKAGLRVIYSSEAERKIDSLIKKTNPQLAHLQNIAHQLSPSILFALERNQVPIIQTLHDLKLACPTYTMYTQDRICEKCISGKYYNAFLKRCNKGSLPASFMNVVEMYTHKAFRSYGKVDLFISPSIFLRNKLIESGVDPERIQYIPNFINAKDFSPHYGNDGYLLYFGQLISMKGVDVLLNAMREFPDIHLVIAGQGKEKKRYETMAHQFNINVSFVGFQSGKTLQKLIKNSLAVIVPSVSYENQPYAILEAFAFGKIVVGSRLGGIPELIDPGRDGFLFIGGDVHDLKDKIRTLYSLNPAILLEMGHNARKKVEQQYSPDIHFDRINSVYKRFV